MEADILSFITGILTLVRIVETYVTDEGLCSGITQSTCFHNQSALCDDRTVMNCNHQLNDENSICQVERINAPDCYIESPSYLPELDDLPFNLQMYYYHTWMLSRPSPNLTFPLSTYENLKFRYQDRDNHKSTICRKLSIENLTQPDSEDLFWDCAFFKDPLYLNHTFDLSVITDEGSGGTYSFRIPPVAQFNPISTKMKDWNVFFFVHLDHWYRSANVPVTIQLAPFENVSYKVALTKCLSDNLECTERSILASKIVERPDTVALIVGDTKQITVLLPSWGNPGSYAIAVQIESPNCPEEGCHIALSPTLTIKESEIGFWLCIGFAFPLAFLFIFTLMLFHLKKGKKKYIEGVKQKQTTVLLSYSPENRKFLELINEFASFLENTCYIRAFVIDNDVGSENPNDWTVAHICKADRVLFLVPNNPSRVSITPIRGQWLYALHYISGHHFASHHFSEKVATVLFPFSGDVPDKIASVRRFHFIREMVSLITWIHDGNWFYKHIFWGPEIKSSSLTKLIQLETEATQALTRLQEEEKEEEEENHLLLLMQNGSKEFSDVSKAKDNHVCDEVNTITSTVQLLSAEGTDSKGYDSDDAATKYKTIEDIFDPEIPNVFDIAVTDNEKKMASNSEESEAEDSDLDDSYFM